ncbi:hypothetical protein LTR78_000074 [Recurvomyces mirabilis]|uniref:Uncharacterized protein n=1 Tax=Recurvomyces mirabilis TaxID=574656 RepID=A0AAE1C675_9PEZI|nr:hypothetical protein LTR78_000074 [Recurvomyces mirabilis]KAK5161730.1 hypothetical protein LTS14_000075 [Recurvomyces mirabilis]
MTGIICSGKTTIYTHAFNGKLTPAAPDPTARNAAKEKIHTAPSIAATSAAPTPTRNSIWQGVSYVSAAKCRAAAAPQTKTPSASKTSLFSRAASTPAMNYSKAVTSQTKSTVTAITPIFTLRVVGP